MLSNSTDIHPSPERIKPRAHVISSQASGRFLSYFKGSCPFITTLHPKKLSDNKMASCAFYVQAIRSCTCVLYEQKRCCFPSKFKVYVNQGPRIRVWILD